jgi:hypothetical protein
MSGTASQPMQAAMKTSSPTMSRNSQWSFRKRDTIPAGHSDWAAKGTPVGAQPRTTRGVPDAGARSTRAFALANRGP